MASQDKTAFRRPWVKFFLISQAIIEIVAVLVYTLTELGNIGSNFWTTNVFAGSWSGLLMLIDIPILLVAATCLPTPKLALSAVIMSVINLLADATLISFNAVFLAQPATCLLTPSCTSNAASTTIFSYTFQQNFFAVFNSLGPFKTYTQSQAKYLFQTVQISVGCLMFVVHLIHLIIYIFIRNKASKEVTPIQQGQGYGTRRPVQQRVDYDDRPPVQQRDDYDTRRPIQQRDAYDTRRPIQQRDDYDTRRPIQQRDDYDTRRPVRAPQVKPGEIPWNKNRRY